MPMSVDPTTVSEEGGEPRRLCPSCGTSDAIADDSLMWPVDWHCASCGAKVAKRDGFPLFAPAHADQPVGMNPSAFAFLADVEKRHFWFRERNRLITGLIRQNFPTAQSFLEIGCGNGVVLAAISQERPWRRLCGSELHPTALRIARARLPRGAEFFQMDARHLPFSSAFDVIGALDVLEHIEEDEAVLFEIARAVRPGGGVILAVPQHPFLWSGSDDAAFHVRRYRRGELEGKVRRAGLTIMRSSSFVSLLMPVMMLSRLFDQSSPGDIASLLQREFAISSLMNSILGGVTRLEVAATLAGMSWPAGGSRVIVAKAPR